MPPLHGKERPVKVTIELPDRIGWALTDHAEARNMILSQMIAGMVLKAFTPTATGSAPSLADRVVTEWSKGAPDAVIAHRLGEPLESVRTARRGRRLTAHKFDRRKWAHELTPSTIQPPASSGVSFRAEEAA